MKKISKNSIILCRLGGDGIYQEVRHAKLISTQGESDGVIFEQTYSISLSDVKKEATKVTMTSEAEMQLEKLRVMDLILGVEDRIGNPDAGLKVSIKKSKNGSVKVISIKAEMCQSRVMTEHTNNLSNEEEWYAEHLSKESKKFLAQLKEKDIREASKWYNKGSFEDAFVYRYKNIKKLAGV